jgi:hypothetical protein
MLLPTWVVGLEDSTHPTKLCRPGILNHAALPIPRFGFAAATTSRA